MRCRFTLVCSSKCVNIDNGLNFWLLLQTSPVYWALFWCSCNTTCGFLHLVQECRLNRASDAKQFRERLEKELSDNSSMSWDKFSKQPHFVVAHYAGKVSYQIEGMMEKNKVQCTVYVQADRRYLCSRLRFESHLHYTGLCKSLR